MSHATGDAPKSRDFRGFAPKRAAGELQNRCPVMRPKSCHPAGQVVVPKRNGLNAGLRALAGVLRWMIFSTGLTALPGVVHASDTCNIVGEDDLRPGETLVDQYRRLEGKRDHWSQEIELNQLEYRRVLDNPF